MSAPTLDLEGLLRRLHLPTVRRLYPELEVRAEGEDLSYRWTVDGDRLFLEAADDPCQERRDVFAGVWRPGR